MEIHRVLELPVSLETARLRLAAALTTPLVVQKGNLILATIVCSGRIEGNALWVQYIEQGRSRVYINVTGHLDETPDGVRLRMTISWDDTSSFLVYLPLLAALLFAVLSSINSGFKAELITNYFVLLLFGSVVTFLLRSLISSFSRQRIANVESILRQISTGRAGRNVNG